MTWTETAAIALAILLFVLIADNVSEGYCGDWTYLRRRARQINAWLFPNTPVEDATLAPPTSISELLGQYDVKHFPPPKAGTRAKGFRSATSVRSSTGSCSATSPSPVSGTTLDPAEPTGAGIGRLPSTGETVIAPVLHLRRRTS